MYLYAMAILGFVLALGAALIIFSLLALAQKGESYRERLAACSPEENKGQNRLPLLKRWPLTPGWFPQRILPGKASGPRP